MANGVLSQLTVQCVKMLSQAPIVLWPCLIYMYIYMIAEIQAAAFHVSAACLQSPLSQTCSVTVVWEAAVGISMFKSHFVWWQVDSWIPLPMATSYLFRALLIFSKHLSLLDNLELLMATRADGDC